MCRVKLWALVGLTLGASLVGGCRSPLALRPGQVSLRAAPRGEISARAGLNVQRLSLIDSDVKVEAVHALLGARAAGPQAEVQVVVTSSPRALKQLRPTVDQARPRHGQSRGMKGTGAMSAKRGGAPAPRKQPGVALVATATRGGSVVWEGELWVPKRAYKRCPARWAAALVSRVGEADETFLDPKCPWGSGMAVPPAR